jgi:hypothetical protein
VAVIDRGQFLRLGVAGVVGTVGAGLLAGPAAAALPVPKPQGDDVGFLSFGAVGELTSRAWYRQALTAKGWSRGERRRLQQVATAKGGHITRINTALAADAILPGDFEANLPASAFASRDKAMALGEQIEALLVNVYLNGAAFAKDSATRLILARLMAYDAQQLAWLRTLRGAPAATGLPVPLSLEQAGPTLDGLIRTPNFPTP